MSDAHDKGRRAFLLGAGGLAAAAGAAMLVADGMTPVQAQQAAQDPDAIKAAALKRYRVLGRTGLKVAPIGIGTASTTSPAVLEQAIDLGLNYIDTAHMYGGGSSETAVGKIMKRRRKDVVLTTKWSPKARTRAQLKASLDESLQRLQTDHVDCLLVHAVDEIDRITSPEVFEAFAEAKKAGKARFLGVSGHGPNLEKVLEKVATMDQYDLVLIKYSFMSYPRMGPLVDKLHAKNIGVTVMKTRDGARHVDLKKFNEDDGGFLGATLRWATSSPKVASAVITTQTFEDVSLYARIAGQELAARDQELLEQYAAAFDKVQCRWCGDCSGACPSGVPVWDVDRAAMYYERYGDQRRGMDLYAALGNPASGCASCAAPCEGSCSYGIPIREQMTAAHQVLAWNPPGDPHV